MKDNNITKSANQVPLHPDWHRYETPAVVRKHGRQFLERMWSNMEGHSHPSGFERVIRHYGAKASESNGITLVSFQDGGRAFGYMVSLLFQGFTRKEATHPLRKCRLPRPEYVRVFNQRARNLGGLLIRQFQQRILGGKARCPGCPTVLVLPHVCLL